MENVAFVDPVGAAGAVSKIVATNVAVVVDALFRELSSLRKQQAIFAAERQSLLEKVMAQYEQQFSAYDANLASLLERISEVESVIRTETLKAGKTLKGADLQAVWATGRVSWDSKLLQGFAIAFPEIEKAKKVGEPSVSIRPVGGAK